MKKSGREIIERIFKELDGKPKNISEIASSVKSYHSTIREYLELIEFIQAQPKLILERTGHSYQAKLENKL